MPQITLDEIRQRIQDKYEPVTIPLPSGGTAELTLPLRLSKERRAELRKLMRANNLAVQAAEDTQKERDDANTARVAAGQPRVELSDDEEDELTEAGEQRTRVYLAGILRVACTDPAAAEELIRQLDGGDADGMLLLVELVKEYMGSTDVGEASPSAS